jgi:hypothetical protein|tara:strand:- start:4707 stop:5519 length:813 start_codon:yes stop_codon:yes gene_type:complete
MKHDLKQATFIIPIRIESEDRLRNVITSVAFLLNNFDTNIIIKEVDKTSVFAEQALPQLESFFGVAKVKHIFEESDEPLFHRQKVLNEMIMEADTEIVVNYDCDVILPLNSYTIAYQGIMNGTYDVVYPYGAGMFQRQVNAEDKLVSEFLDGNNYDGLDRASNEHTSDFGWAQFFRRSVYIQGGMENENFRAYAPEDKERYFRFTTLGYKVGRVNDVVYHLEHARGDNSWFSNPHMQSNMSEWEKICRMDKMALMEYYSNQDYLKKYVSV